MQPVLGTCRRVSRRKSLLCSRPFSLVSGRRFQTGKDLKSVQRPPASEQSRPSTAWPPELRRAAGPHAAGRFLAGLPRRPCPRRTPTPHRLLSTVPGGNGPLSVRDRNQGERKAPVGREEAAVPWWLLRGQWRAGRVRSARWTQ